MKTLSLAFSHLDFIWNLGFGLRHFVHPVILSKLGGKVRKVAVIGTTAWGTTLGIMLAAREIDVILWARTEEEAIRLNANRENIARVPGVPFPESLKTTASPVEALLGADLTILGVPAQTMRDNLGLIKEHFEESTLILSISKGVEIETTKRMSEVIAEELAPGFGNQIAVLSGPNFSKEVGQGLDCHGDRLGKYRGCQDNSAGNVFPELQGLCQRGHSRC